MSALVTDSTFVKLKRLMAVNVVMFHGQTGTNVSDKNNASNDKIILNNLGV